MNNSQMGSETHPAINLTKLNGDFNTCREKEKNNVLVYTYKSLLSDYCE